MNSYEKMLAHVWIELNSKINKIESGEISPEDRAKLDAIPATASALNPVALESQIPDITGLADRVTAAEGDIDDIQAVIPSGASTSNKLVTASDIPDVTSLTQRVTAAEGDIDGIQAVIPSGASTSDKLALSSSVDYLSQLYGVVSEDVDNIQAVIPSGASSSNKLALSSDIPKDLNVYSVILSPLAWSSIPDASGYYDANYTILDVSNDMSFKPFVFGTTEAFNLVDKIDATNNMLGVYLTLKSKVIPSSNVEFDIYLKT